VLSGSLRNLGGPIRSLVDVVMVQPLYGLVHRTIGGQRREVSNLDSKVKNPDFTDGYRLRAEAAQSSGSPSSSGVPSHADGRVAQSVVLCSKRRPDRYDVAACKVSGGTATTGPVLRPHLATLPTPPPDLIAQRVDVGAGTARASSCRYGAKSLPSSEPRPIRIVLPSGSVSVNSVIPHGLASSLVTGSAAVLRRVCQASVSGVIR
jgi:hypothetical protein